jgi:hypothetical protein
MASVLVGSVKVEPKQLSRSMVKLARDLWAGAPLAVGQTARTRAQSGSSLARP